MPRAKGGGSKKFGRNRASEANKRYINNDTREKNKAKRVIADCNRSANPEKTLQSILLTLNPKVANYARKTMY